LGIEGLSGRPPGAIGSHKDSFLDKVILDKVILDKVILDKVILDKVILDNVILDNVILVPSGPQLFGLDTTFGRSLLPQQVQGHMSHGGQVLLPMPLSHSTFVLPNGKVQHPVDTVLYAPMLPNGPELLSDNYFYNEQPPFNKRPYYQLAFAGSRSRLGENRLAKVDGS
jgi:hypothetical protein